MSLSRFLISKSFFKHLGIILIALVAIVFITLKLLASYTLHGEEYSLPNYTGLTTDELKEYSLGDQMEFTIIDSVYDANRAPGTILAQNPLPGAKVKTGRNVYLTVVTETPEKVKMPNLLDLTLRQSISLLETYGLKINKLEYIQDLAKNAVLQQIYDGNVINPGTEIYKGSSVDLILGTGRSNNDIKVPFLIGKKQSQVIDLLHKNSLNIGEQYFLDSEDLSKLRAYSSSPSSANAEKVEMGSYVNVYYRSDENFDFFELIKEIEMRNADTITDNSAFDSDEFFSDEIIVE